MNAKDYMPALYAGHLISPSNIMGGGGLATGNVYWVKHSTDADYPDFYTDRQTVYSDDSNSVHTTIQSAVTAAVSGRGDVIIVAPGSWKENVLVNKTCLRIIGAGYGTGSTSTRMLPTDGPTKYPIGALTLGASQGAAFTVVATQVEITGFYLDGAGGYSGIYVGGGLYSTSCGYTTANASGCWIHHNFFRGGASEGDFGIFADGPRFGCVFEDNIFERQSEAGIYLTPGNASNEFTIIRRNEFQAHNAAYGIFIYGSTNAALGCLIRENSFFDRSANAFTYAIKNNGCDGVVAYVGNFFCCANTLVAAATDFVSGNSYGFAGSATETSNFFITEAAAGAEA